MRPSATDPRRASAVARSPASRFILSLAAFVVVVAGLRAAAPLVLPVMVAVFLAVVTLPMVAWLHQRRVPRPVAVLCTVAANMAGLAGIVVLLATSINEFTAASPRYQARLHLLVVSVLDWLAGHGIEVPPTVYVDLLNPAALLEVVRTGLVAALAVLSNIFLVLLTLVFLLFEAPTCRPGSRPRWAATSSGSRPSPARSSATWRSRRSWAPSPGSWSAGGWPSSASTSRCSGA